MTNTQNTATIAFAAADAFLATKTTNELLAMSARLRGNQPEAARMTRAAINDTITNRLGLSELIDTIYVDDLDFEGDYYDAMIESIARKAA